MELFIFFLKMISAFLSVITTSLFVYQIAMGLFGVKKPLKAIPKINKQHRFAVLIAARNEESVISHLIQSLHNQEYPSDLFDIFVIADNCTDDTANICRKLGAIVYERFNKTHVGKGYALNYFFDKLKEDYPDQYDACCIFDADNVVSKVFLSEMNLQLCAGHMMATGYRDTKNPHDTWVTGCYALYWMTLTRFFHNSRSALGLSAMVGGTGFMFHLDLIAQYGWQTKTLTEDSEFSLQCIADGHKIHLAYDAVFYDEQPLTFSESITQRYRWAIGSIQCVQQCLPTLVKSLIYKGNLMALDSIMFLLLTPSIALVVLSFVVQIILATLNLASFLSGLPVALLSIFISYCAIVFQGFALLKLEKKSIKRYTKSLLMYPLFTVSVGVISMVGLFYRNVSWKPIKHTKSVSLEQIDP